MSGEIEKTEEANADAKNSNAIISDEKDAEIEAAEEKRSRDNTAAILGEKRELSPPMLDEEAKKICQVVRAGRF